MTHPTHPTHPIDPVLPTRPMPTRSRRRRRIPLVTGVALALALASACASDAEPLPWPQVPEGFTAYADATNESVIDTLVVGTRSAAGDAYQLEEQLLLDPGTADRADIIAAYADQLPESDGWEEATTPSGSIGRSWAAGDQRFVVMIVELSGDVVVVTMASTLD